MLEQAMRLFKALTAPQLVELAGAALVVAGTCIAFGVAPALVVGGVCLVFKAADTERRRHKPDA